MKIKRKNLTRLASISALGAGALGAGAGTAQAGIVYTAINTKVGFSPGSTSSFSFFPNTGFGGFSVYGRYNTHFRPITNGYAVSAFFKMVLSGFSGMKFQNAPGPGAIWAGPPANGFQTATLVSQTQFFKYIFGTPSSPPHYVNSGTHTGGHKGQFYMLFTFNPTGSQDDYGWLRLSGSPLGSCGCGPDLTVLDLAYEDSGALLPAGQAPEPAPMIPTGLAALALGATGIRRWRAARNKAA